jgi:hypothetical protein
MPSAKRDKATQECNERALQKQLKEASESKLGQDLKKDMRKCSRQQDWSHIPHVPEEFPRVESS